MTNITQALVIVMSINIMLFLGQVSVLELNPEGDLFFNCTNTLIGDLEESNCQGNTYALTDTDPVTGLPRTESDVNAETGNIFTDTFNAAKDWLTGITGLDYVVAMVTAPKNFLMSIGAPPAFSFAVGVLWYSITFFLLVAWLLGRDG